MTRRDEMVRMAQEAGLIELRKKGWAPIYQGGADDIERFAALVAETERERCAAECERMMMYPGGRCEAPAHDGVWAAAKAIRALKDEVIE